MLTEIPPRLRWACRRGMLELDVLLGNFLEEAFIQQTARDQDIFMTLLNCQDQDLFNWLTGKVPATTPDTQRLVEKILHHAKHRPRS